MVDFCAQRGISTASLCTWRKRLREEGDAGLSPRPNARNASGPHRGALSYTPEQRRAAVEAFLKAGQTITDFARVFGVSRDILSRWIKRYRADGPKGLEPRRRGRPKGSRAGTRVPTRVGQRIAQPVRDLIARTKTRFPSFGLLKVRQFLLRFHAVKVSTGGVKRALQDAGVPVAPPLLKRVRRAPPAVRSFERAKPMELWQSDITSFPIGRHRERAYLTVFLDDSSRYVVSFALHLQQKSELVIEALKDGIARFGKPQEILTDQGRQYFSWRGKSEFQWLLKRDGIRHVVARSHHPQTVGKCERLWETVKQELLDRVELKDVADARLRLAHYFAHYNFFRPHQGIDGLVPADRFFSVQAALRQALEAQLQKNELSLALHEAPPPPVFLFGQIGDQQVVMHGERGRVVIRTAGGEERELVAEEIEVNGAPPLVPELRDDQEEEELHGRATDDVDALGRSDTGGEAQAAHAGAAQAPPVGGAADAGAGQSAVGGSERGGEGARPSHCGGDAAGVAGQNAPDGSGGAAAADAGACLATEPASGGRDGGGALEAAAPLAPERRAADGREPLRGGGGSEAPEEGERGAQAQAQDRGGRDCTAERVSSAAPASARRDEEHGGAEHDGSSRSGGSNGAESNGNERGGEQGHPGAHEEAPRDAQTESSSRGERGCECERG